MKQGMTLANLAHELKRQQYAKRDFVAPTTQLHMYPGEYDSPPRLIVGDTFEGPLNRVAHAQVAQHLNIPKVYYDRMKEEQPGLLAQNVNIWLNERPQDDTRMVRTLDGNVRAFLSGRYRPLDNAQLAEAALPALQESGCEIVNCELTDSRMYIRALSPRLKAEVVGESIQGGIHISNSECGEGAVNIRTFTMDLLCLNGMVGERAMRKTHLGRGMTDLEGAREFFLDDTREADDKAFFLKVRDTVGGVISEQRFRETVNRIRAAKEQHIEAKAITEIVELTGKKYRLTESETSSVLTHVIERGDLSTWGLVSGVTRAAADVDSFDRSVELESIGTRIMELKPQEWNSLTKAAA